MNKNKTLEHIELKAEAHRKMEKNWNKSSNYTEANYCRGAAVALESLAAWIRSGSAETEED